MRESLSTDDQDILLILVLSFSFLFYFYFCFSKHISRRQLYGSRRAHKGQELTEHATIFAKGGLDLPLVDSSPLPFVFSLHISFSFFLFKRRRMLKDEQRRRMKTKWAAAMIDFVL
jgi:hypothetical protein